MQAGGTKHGPFLDFSRKTAICARVTELRGQYSPGAQPAVMPLATSLTMWKWNWLPPSGTSVKSAIQPSGSVPAMPLGLVTVTSLRVPGGKRRGRRRDGRRVDDVDVPSRDAADGHRRPVLEEHAIDRESRAAPGGPEVGKSIEKTMRCENSEVLPSGSVAVAVMRAPGSTFAGSVMSKDALPEPFVVTCVEPRYSSPSRNSCGRFAQGGFE